jgi:hypothetical protein
MKMNSSRLNDAAATALLVYTVVALVHGAFRGSAALQSLVGAALCVLFCVAVWTSQTRAKRWVGRCLVLMGIAAGLAAWRFRVPIPFGCFLTTAYLIIGILMIAMNRNDRAQHAVPAYRR